MLLLVGLMVVVETLQATSLRAETPPRVLITVDAPTAAARTALVAKGYDVWSATLEGVTLAVPPAEVRRLQSQGYKVQQVEAVPLVFPPNYSGYHDYAETVTELQGLAARYPDVTRLQSIGKSVEGRDLWALRITDHPRDPNEPGEKGILIYAGTHAREHLTVEQALFVAHDLLDNYGHEGEATNLVNQRDIWILPNLNPDGSEHDIASGNLIWWRKNRRNNGDGTLGVDLNRNFGYKWGAPDGSSGATSSETYRGPQSFSEPENQALRDFVTAHDNIKVSISLHTYGELVLYPYGYTYADLPPDMKPADLAIFKALAGAMATRNGYAAQQASDLYIVSGDHDDWFYGVGGIYAMTMEMYPTSSSPFGFYPPDSVIAPQTARNRTALRYSIAMADDPAKSTGQGKDMAPPTVQILTPGDGATVTADTAVSVTVAVSDTVGVTTVAYLVDGQPVAVRTAPDFAAALTLAPGDHVLEARAFDNAHWQTHVAVSVRAVMEAATPTPTTTPSPTATPTSTVIPFRLYLPLLRATTVDG